MDYLKTAKMDGQFSEQEMKVLVRYYDSDPVAHAKKGFQLDY